MYKAIKGGLWYRSVVEVALTDFNPRTFFNRYRDQVIWSEEFDDLISRDEIIGESLRENIGYIDLTETRTLTAIARPVRLWHLACLIEREVKRHVDPAFSPLLRGPTKESAFQVEFHLGTGVLGGPRHPESRLITVRRREAAIRLTLARVPEVSCKAGTRVFSSLYIEANAQLKPQE